jgi:propanediol dehydratase small subunit
VNAPDPLLDYPLGERRPELVTTPAGTPLAEVTLEGLRSGRVSPAELRATPETLLRQAAVARSAGREQLAENLERAAELAALPDDEVLAVYTALRPRRATAAELEAMAQQLAAVAAPRCAAFVREAAEVMAERGLLRTPA